MRNIKRAKLHIENAGNLKKKKRKTKNGEGKCAKSVRKLKKVKLKGVQTKVHGTKSKGTRISLIVW